MASDQLSILPIKLHGAFPDDDAVMVSFDGRLVAILLRLSHIHDDLEGRWFIEWASEADFADRVPFECMDDATNWLFDKIKH